MLRSMTPDNNVSASKKGPGYKRDSGVLNSSWDVDPA